MPKLPLILVAVAFALTGAVVAAQAQGKAKTKEKDRDTCTKLVMATIPSGGNYGAPACMPPCRAAIERCMRGEPIW